MTTPITPISLLDIQTEFGGAAPISLSEYYAGGPYVVNPAPTSAYQTDGIVHSAGTISLGNFRGLSSYTVNYHSNGDDIDGWITSAYRPYSD